MGPYEIVALLGSGGMGEVYRARDTRLERLVAIKLLPADLTRDESAKHRFVQEAKAASALDHPSICTIHDIGETPDGRIYLAMAHYDGDTLKERIDRAALSVPEALDIAIDLGRGLVEAHSKGIVHRDLKPANVMFSADGHPKLLDFGLAKLSGHTGVTETGVALGTVAYMSPEQTRGESVDARADLWALGAVLHEMIAGHPAFGGDSYFAVAAAIATTSPLPLTAVRAGTPLELERIVHRALAKDPSDRYQTAADMVAELARLRASLAIGGSAPRPLPAAVSTGGSRWRWPAVAAALAVVAALVYLVARPAPPERAPLRLTNAVQVTSLLGVEDYPAWSPDGLTLAYAANPDSDLYGGNWDIWLTQSRGGEAVNRTSDHTGDDRFPSWSPDGRQIAFWSARDGGGYFVMPALGGTPRRVLSTGGVSVAELGPPRWSPDATELAGVRYEGADAFAEITTLATGEARRIGLPARGKALDLSWSPGGRFFAYIDGGNLASQVSTVRLVELASGTARELTDPHANAWSPAWSRDERSLYYVSNQGGSMDLWEQRLAANGAPAGPPEPVTTGIGMMRIALSPDHTRLAYSRGRRVANLWRVPILESEPASWADAEQLTFDQAFVEFIDVSRDGQRVLLDSDRSGNPDLWILEEGQELRQLTTDPAPDWAPRWSSDGSSIVFYSFRTGNRDVWILPVDGGPPRQVTDDPAAEWVPTWSPSGTEVAFTSARSGDPDIWVAPATGGPARQVAPHPGEDRRAHWSPDGEWIAFVSSRGGQLQVWRARPDGSEAEQLSEGSAYYPSWSPDATKIYFTSSGTRGGNLWELDLRTRAERAVTDLSGRRGSIGDLALATDGRHLYFAWEEDLGDIWTMDVSPDGLDR